MFCIWKFAFKYINVNCIYWLVVNLSMHFISVSLEYFVCFCDKYFYFILNEYFFSIGHYLYPKLVVCGRCICDKYFFSICHYLWKVHPLCLYPKLVGCGQVWEADYGIKSISYVFVMGICILFWMSISSVFVIICIPSWWVVARCERQTAGLWEDPHWPPWKPQTSAHIFIHFISWI